LGAAQKAFLPHVHERASIPVQVAQAGLARPALLGFAPGWLVRMPRGHRRGGFYTSTC
jgi:hypothetical protein